jgi:predicted Fe-S protein YdhL (DUF1289 family)
MSAANLWAFIDDHDEQFDAETNTFVCAGCKRRTDEGSAGDDTLIGDNCCDTCWWNVQEAARRTALAIGRGRLDLRGRWSRLTSSQRSHVLGGHSGYYPRHRGVEQRLVDMGLMIPSPRGGLTILGRLLAEYGRHS